LALVMTNRLIKMRKRPNKYAQKLKETEFHRERRGKRSNESETGRAAKDAMSQSRVLKKKKPAHVNKKKENK